jgi:imidazolonepropionase-like amidohydrolase
MLLIRCALAGGPLAAPALAGISPRFDVRYDEGVVKAVGSLEPLRGEEVLDLAGAHLCPGLVDAHVHLALGGAAFPPGPAADRVRENIAAHRARGVTAVRDLGGHDTPIDASATWERGDRVRLPRVVSSRGAITRRGAYGGFLGVALGPGQDVVGAVRQQAIAGADVVKVILTGSVDFARGTAASAHFTERELGSMVAAAHAEGIPLAVHANGAEAVRMAVETGADSIEHGILADEDTVAAMADSDVVWVPTLSPLHALDPDAVGVLLPSVLAAHETMVARAREAGVRIATGTDGGSPGVPHGSLLAEIAHLRALGFSPAEAREAAGPVGADLLRLTPGYGRLEVGAATDLVWFDHDPFLGRVEDDCPPRPLGMLAGQ